MPSRPRQLFEVEIAINEITNPIRGGMLLDRVSNALQRPVSEAFLALARQAVPVLGDGIGDAIIVPGVQQHRESMGETVSVAHTASEQMVPPNLPERLGPESRHAMCYTAWNGDGRPVG